MVLMMPRFWAGNTIEQHTDLPAVARQGVPFCRGVEMVGLTRGDGRVHRQPVCNTLPDGCSVYLPCLYTFVCNGGHTKSSVAAGCVLQTFVLCFCTLVKPSLHNAWGLPDRVMKPQCVSCTTTMGSTQVSLTYTSTLHNTHSQQLDTLPFLVYTDTHTQSCWAYCASFHSPMSIN